MPWRLRESAAVSEPPEAFSASSSTESAAPFVSVSAESTAPSAWSSAESAEYSESSISSGLLMSSDMSSETIESSVSALSVSFVWSTTAVSSTVSTAYLVVTSAGTRTGWHKPSAIASASRKCRRRLPLCSAFFLMKSSFYGAYEYYVCRGFASPDIKLEMSNEVSITYLNIFVKLCGPGNRPPVPPCSTIKSGTRNRPPCSTV